MIEGSGSVSLTNGSGFGSVRPKNIWILRIRIRIRIRIRHTAVIHVLQFLEPLAREGLNAKVLQYSSSPPPPPQLPVPADMTRREGWGPGGEGMTQIRRQQTHLSLFLYIPMAKGTLSCSLLRKKVEITCMARSA
jgi:hypothetical protein